jgi:hypothetical protein
MEKLSRIHNPRITDIPCFWLLSDVVAINRHRQYEGGYRGTRVSAGRGSGLSYTVGGQRDKSVEYGDLVISSPVAEDQTWYGIKDCSSVVRLIKSLRKTRIEQLKQMEQIK